MGNLQRPLSKSATLVDCDDKVMTVAVQMYV